MVSGGVERRKTKFLKHASCFLPPILIPCNQKLVKRMEIIPKKCQRKSGGVKKAGGYNYNKQATQLKTQASFAINPSETTQRKGSGLYLQIKQNKTYAFPPFGRPGFQSAMQSNFFKTDLLVLLSCAHDDAVETKNVPTHSHAGKD